VDDVQDTLGLQKAKEECEIVATELRCNEPAHRETITAIEQLLATVFDHASRTGVTSSEYHIDRFQLGQTIVVGSDSEPGWYPTHLTYAKKVCRKDDELRRARAHPAVWVYLYMQNMNTLRALAETLHFSAGASKVDACNTLVPALTTVSEVNARASSFGISLDPSLSDEEEVMRSSLFADFDTLVQLGLTDDFLERWLSLTDS
jgi:hypothetical protein